VTANYVVHERTSEVMAEAFALGSEADMYSAQAHIRFGPIADISWTLARSVRRKS
jgi:hypothetical protein